MLCNLKGNHSMKKGKAKTFFRPTRFKIITAIIIAALYPISATITFSHFFSTSSVYTLPAIIYIFFSFPTWIISMTASELYHSVPMPVWIGTNALFTLAVSYLGASTICAVFKKR